MGMKAFIHVLIIYKYNFVNGSISSAMLTLGYAINVRLLEVQLL